ncbi:MAG: hypothetical protein QGH11_05690, partial [Pirellulaceae bacterium]|nr:hypothetical protein [Pirellulaceae bacterium]
MTCWKFKTFLLILSLPLGVTTTSAEPPRLGGPYKLLAADFTGDSIVDLAVGFHDLGLLTIERGNGRGRFKHLAITPIRAPNGEGFV